YVVMLGGVGALMLVESGRAILMRRRGGGGRRKKHVHTWIHGLPLKMRFRTSRLYISALLPLGIGFAVGILAALMGVGGGFFLVPAMIYLLGMPVTIVIGTSLYQITVVAGATTFLHAISGQTVDIVLAGVLTIGAVVGAQLGTRFGAGIRGEELRGLLALMVLIVCAALFWELVATPQEMFNLSDLMVMP
ncbi:MAG: sulfite exporter TauE/SafE family protein, partial [Proteobacteria bacterium]|nr:sulfite exporter TauE/SafE family protein [Pseudomonadota bacterium]